MAPSPPGFTKRTYPFTSREAEESSLTSWLEVTGTAPTPLSVENAADSNLVYRDPRFFRGLLGRRRPQLPSRRAGGWTLSRSDAPSARRAIRRGRRASSRAASRSRSAGKRGRTGASPPGRGPPTSSTSRVSSNASSSRGSSPRPWRGSRSPPRPSSRARPLCCETADGKLVGVASVVSESERARRRLPEGVCAAEIVVEAVPARAAGCATSHRRRSRLSSRTCRSRNPGSCSGSRSRGSSATSASRTWSRCGSWTVTKGPGSRRDASRPRFA